MLPPGYVRCPYFGETPVSFASLYAFVHYDFNEEAVKAIRHLDGVPIPGRGVVLSLEWANIRRR